MASKPKTDSTSTAAPKKARKLRRAGYFLATLTGESEPVLIVAKNLKAAQAAIVSIKAASPADLIDAGKREYRVIDITSTSAQTESTVTDISQAA